MKYFINCLKPPGMTSHDVVGFIRKLLNFKKVGHAGTLDPGVTGVLPIAVGKATRAIEYLNSDKRYRCEAILGISTTTQDLYGKVIERKECRWLKEELILEQFKSFIGTIEQTPSIYSALKIKGKRLYQMARKGETVFVPARKVYIKELSVIDIKKERDYFVVLFDVMCQKGTYVRTICHDLGQALGCGGTMSFLIRTQAGPFSIQDAVTLEQLIKTGSNPGKTISINEALTELDLVKVDNIHLQKLRNGMAIPLNPVNSFLNKVKVLDNNNELLGIGEYFTNEQGVFLKMKKNLFEE